MNIDFAKINSYLSIKRISSNSVNLPDPEIDTFGLQKFLPQHLVKTKDLKVCVKSQLDEEQEYYQQKWNHNNYWLTFQEHLSRVYRFKSARSYFFEETAFVKVGGQDTHKKLEKEIEIYAKASHPNLILCHGQFADPEGIFLLKEIFCQSSTSFLLTF